MLVLDGRACGLLEDGYTAKSGARVNTYDLSVATEDGVLVCRIPEAVLQTLQSEVYRLKQFGQGVQIKVRPRLRFEYGEPKAGLEALAIRLLDAEDAELASVASNGSEG